MTEAEWLACKNPEWMLDFVRDKASERKLRLFACACARAVWAYLGEPQRRAVEAAERVADGLAGPAELAHHRPQRMGVAAGSGRTAAEEAIRRAVCIIAEEKFGGRGGGYSASRMATATIHPLACALARCVFSPSRPRPDQARWRAADVVAVAQGTYADRPSPDGALDRHRLSVLSDALEEAGCAGPELLGHLRSAGPHVRGCWALDLILGKE